MQVGFESRQSDFKACVMLTTVIYCITEGSGAKEKTTPGRGHMTAAGRQLLEEARSLWV